MIGDGTDILGRLRSLLPPSWFSNPAQPLLNTDGIPLFNTDGQPLLNTTPGPPILVAVLQAPSTLLAFIYALLAYVKLQTRIKTATDGWLDLIANDFFGPTFTRSPGQTDASFSAAIVAQIFLIRNTRPSIISVLTSLTGVAPIVFEPWRIPDCGALNETLYYNAYGLRGSRTLPANVFVTAYRGNGVSDAAIYAAVNSVRSAGVAVWVQILNP